MTLEELQRRFSECIRDDWPQHGLPFRSDGLSIYRNNYREQLRFALRMAFPYLVLWLGESVFDRLAETHIALHFPRSWTLDHYGYDFAATAQALFPTDPEVAELAWIEWAIAEAMVAPDDRSVEKSRLGDLDWDDANIMFSSSLRLSEARSNAAEIWAAFEEGLTPPAAMVLEEPGALLVWRHGLLPCFRSISASEFQVISALKHGRSFPAACEILRLRLGTAEAIEAAGAMLGGWLRDGIITSVHGKRTEV